MKNELIHCVFSDPLFGIVLKYIVMNWCKNVLEVEPDAFCNENVFLAIYPDFVVQRMCIGRIVVDRFLTETILPLDMLVF